MINYLNLINELTDINTRYTLAYSKYFATIFSCDKIKTIVIGQDPYKTDIYPEYASAFSYDTELSYDITPSVSIISEALTYKYGEKYSDPSVFINSFLLVNSGIIYINASYTNIAFSTTKVKEMIMTVSALRDIILSKKYTEDDKIEILAMGNSAQEMASMLTSSIGKDIKVKVVRVVHPAMLARLTIEERIKRDYFENSLAYKILKQHVDTYGVLKIIGFPIMTEAFLTTSNAISGVITNKNNIQAESLKVLKLKIESDDKVTPADFISLIDIVSNITQLNINILNSYSSAMKHVASSRNSISGGSYRGGGSVTGSVDGTRKVNAVNRSTYGGETNNSPYNSSYNDDNKSTGSAKILFPTF